FSEPFALAERLDVQPLIQQEVQILRAKQWSVSTAGSILPIVAWPRVVAHLTSRCSPAVMSVVLLVEPQSGIRVKCVCLLGAYSDVDGIADTRQHVPVGADNEFLLGNGIVAGEPTVDVFVCTELLDQVDCESNSLLIRSQRERFWAYAECDAAEVGRACRVNDRA